MLTGAGGNILVRTASAGQVLVDSGAAEFTDAVLARLRGLPGAGRVDNSVQHALAPGPGGRKPRLRAVGGDDHRS